MTLHRLLIATALVGVAAPAWGQAANESIPLGHGRVADAITVTGSPIVMTWTGQSVSVLTTAQIDAIQGPDLSRALERLPGVAVARNGGLGGTTSYFVRGGDSDQLLVMIDGVRVADLASPGGNYDTGPVLLNGIARIELLRGSNSVIWGSQAMSGVLAITTREVNGAEGSAEYGAYNSTALSARAGLSRDRYALSINAGYEHSDGIPPKVGDLFDGGIDSWTLGGKARVMLTRGLTLKLNARYADTRLTIDQFGPATQWTRDTSGAATLSYARDGFTLDAQASLADVRRHYATAFGPSDYYGLEQRFVLTGKADLPARLRLDFGAEHVWDRAFDTFDARNRATVDSGHALLGYYSDRLSLAAGARIDSHDRFGTHVTLGGNGTWQWSEQWRLRAAYGEGFKAPSLYQLYGSFVGNLALRPETARNYEAGVEWGRRGTTFASATWFRRDSRNLIDLDNSFTYANVAQARSVGLELEAGAHVSQALAFTGNLTLLSATDLQRARALARRPRQTVNLSADWTRPGGAITLGADLRFAAKTVDYTFGGTALPIASHVTGTLRAAWRLNARLDLYGRVENVGDASYQTAYGYNTPGRSAYLGVRVRM